MRKQIIFTLLTAMLLLGIVSSQTNRIQLSQFSKTGATTGQGITYNGTNVVWGNPTPVFSSQAANQVFAAPNGAAGVPAFRALVVADVPTLNQNTTGSASFTANTALTDGNADRGTGLRVINYSLATNTPSAAGMMLEWRRASGSGSDIGSVQIATDNTGTNTDLYYRRVINFSAGDVYSPWFKFIHEGTVNLISNTMLAQMPSNSIKCNNLGVVANSGDCTAAETAAILPMVQVNSVTVTGAVNLNKTVPATPAGSQPITYQTSGTNPASVSSFLDRTDEFDAIRRKPFLSIEFLTTTTPLSEFSALAIGAGTNITAPAAGILGANHPGVILARSSTTANSGFFYSTNQSMIRLGGGEQVDAIVWIPATITGTTLRFGFLDVGGVTDAVDGVYIELAAALTATCKTSSNSVRTTSPTVATLTASTWYHVRIQVSSTTSATCSIFSDAGALLGSQTNTTNIPSAAGREVGVSAIGTNSGVVATDLYAIDFLSVGWNTALARGK